MCVETPDQMIVSTRQLFDFSCFLVEAIFEENITPATLPRKIRLDTGGQGIFVEGHFTQEGLAAIAAGSRMNALGTLAIATDSAIDFVFGAKDAQDMLPLGSARSIVYQLRCAYAHDPANPVWRPVLPKYGHTYWVPVQVPQVSGTVATRVIEVEPVKLMGRPLEYSDLGGLGNYPALFDFCQCQVKLHPKGQIPVV